MKRRGNPCRADYPLTMSSPFLYSVQSRPCAFAGAASPTLKTTTDRGAAWRKFLNPSDNSSWFHSHLLPASRIFVTFFLFPMKPALMSSAKGKLNLISTLSSPHRGLSARGNKRNIITTVKISPIIPICSSQEAPTTQVSESPYCNYSPQIPKLQIILSLPACRLLPLHLVIQPGSEKCTAVLQESSETSPHLTIPRRTGKCAHFPDFSVRPYL